MVAKLRKFFSIHFEWVAFSIGLILIVSMNPYVYQGSSICLFDIAGIGFCPGEGLGHSIAFFFRGDLNSAMEANALGPFAAFVIIFRIGYLIKNNIINNVKFRESYG